MAKAVIHSTPPTPTEQIVNAARASATVTDTKGRVIEVKRLAPLDRMRMSKAAGSENATNQPYMLYALVASSVTAIDGDPQFQPVNELQLEAMISRLGQEGYDAALDAVLSMYGGDKSEEVVAAAKK